MVTRCSSCRRELEETSEKYLLCHRCNSFTPNHNILKGGNAMTEKKTSEAVVSEVKLNKKSFIEMAEKIKAFSDKEFADLTIDQKLKVNHQYWKLLKQEQKK